MNGNTNVVRHKPAERRAKMLALLDEIGPCLDRWGDSKGIAAAEELRAMIDPHK